MAQMTRPRGGRLFCFRNSCKLSASFSRLAAVSRPLGSRSKASSRPSSPASALSELWPISTNTSGEFELKFFIRQDLRVVRIERSGPSRPSTLECFARPSQIILPVGNRDEVVQADMDDRL